MTYEQPTLPYSETALEPVISAETIRYHYGKHEKAYIDNLNRLIKGTEYEDAELEDIIEEADGALFNNASQAWNHIFYFFSFSPDGSREPGGELRKAIDRDFGSFDQLTFDVWEHAYYIDYKNLRADYLRQLWNIVDWDVVESRY